MKKILVQAGNVDSYICQGCNTIYVDGNMLLTPGAKDEISKRKAKIVRGPVPEVCCAPAEAPSGIAESACCAGETECSEECERLVIGIAAMLKDEYGITDLEQLKKLSCKLAVTIKNNI